jgi:hypothetical protein
VLVEEIDLAEIEASRIGLPFFRDGGSTRTPTSQRGSATSAELVASHCRGVLGGA